MKKLLMAVAAVAAVWGAKAATGNVAYSNDFEQRTSAKPVDPGRWYELDYVCGASETSGTDGTLYYGFDPKVFDRKPLSFISGAKTQDGWVAARLKDPGGGGKDEGYNYTPGFYCRPDEKSGDNPYGQFNIGGGIGYYSVALHPIHNAFLNGIVRMEIDMRVPSKWVGTDKSYNMRVMLVRQNLMNPNWGSLSNDHLAQFGFQYNTSKKWNESFLLHSKTDGGGIAGRVFAASGDGNLTAGHWYRFVLDHNLDTHKLSGTATDLGTGHPTFDSTGTLIGTLPSSGVYFAHNSTSAHGPVTGIGLQCYGARTTENSVFYADRAAAYDNIRVSWKAPGASDYETCYENDFTSRRYRVLCPAGSTASDYAALAETPATDSYSYSTGFLVPASDTTAATKAAIPPPGIDGWRRHNSDGLADFKVDGNVLYALNVNAWAAVAHPIGCKVTSGKVRLQADFRTPDAWHWTSSQGIYLSLGGDKLYKSVSSEAGYAKTACANVGVGKGDSSSFVVAYSDATANQKRQDKVLAAKTWYQAVLTYDLDSRTYDYAITKREDGSAVDAQTGVPFRDNGVAEISTLALFAYASAATVANAIAFDNLKVWTDVGTENEELVYENDFATRTRKVSNTAGAIVPALCDREGTDGWQRRYAADGSADIRLIAGANPALGVSAPDNSVCAVQQMGSELGDGRIELTCDIRPPYCWADATGCAGVVLGGDGYFQGNAQQDAYFDGFAFAKVGFAAAGSANGKNGLYYTTQAKVFMRESAAAELTEQTLDAKINPTHWYRFSVRSDRVGATTATVKLYDMGAAHPDVSTANGTLVATLTGVCLPYDELGKITSHGLYATRTQSFESYAAEDAGLVLFDNLVWRNAKGGLIIVIQ